MIILNRVIYFVTLCTQRHLCLFGEINDAEMLLNDAGQLVDYWWGELPKKFSQVELDAHITMPNHVHGLVLLKDDSEEVSISVMLRWFKTMTTNAYIRGVHEQDWQPFYKKLWQRSFHDHVVRHEKEIDGIRDYIVNNPLRWHDDKKQSCKYCHTVGTDRCVCPSCSA